jgi:hypothetical protein
MESPQSYSIFSDVSPELRSVVQDLVNYPISKATLNSQSNVKKYTERTAMVWGGAYLWVLHHQRKNTKEKDPMFNDPYMMASEKFGIFLNCLLEICRKSLTLIDKLKIEFNSYNCALDWWKFLCNEMVDDHIHEREALMLFRGASKKGLARIKAEVETLLAFENLFSPDKHPELFNLVEVCRVIGKYDPHDSNVIEQEKKELRNLWSKCWKNYRYLPADWKKHGEFITGICTGHDIWVPQKGRQKPKLVTAEGFLKQKRKRNQTGEKKS